MQHDTILEKKIESYYHISSRKNYSLDAERMKNNVVSFSKKFLPVNSSLNHAAMNSNVEKALIQISTRIHHFNKEIEAELSKLNTKDFPDKKSTRFTTNSTYISKTPLPPLVVTPVYKKLEEVTQTNKKKIKLNEKITEKSTKAIIDPLFKSIPMHVDPSFQYEKVQKRHFRKPDLNKIEKIIEDCSNSSENIKKSSRILKKWQRFNSFDNKERLNFIDKDDLQIDNNAIIRYLVSTKKMKKL